MKKIVLSPGGEVLAERAFFARSLWARLRGLIGRRFASAGFDAMVFENCNAVHCCWMSEAIDVIFVSRELVVTKVCSGVKPWGIACGGHGTCHTIEIPCGNAEKYEIKVGGQLEFV